MDASGTGKEGSNEGNDNEEMGSEEIATQQQVRRMIFITKVCGFLGCMCRRKNIRKRE